jgi:hypothetical protein
MATTFNWKIISMQQWPSGANTGYVVNVNWKLTGTDGVQTASINGDTQYSVIEAASNFCPYVDLQEATVVEWVQKSLGEQGIFNMKANVQGQIDNLNNPSIVPVVQPLPWLA